MTIELKHFSQKTETRLLKLRYDVLPVLQGKTVNLNVEDEIIITRVEKNSITFECTRTLTMMPKSIFELTGTCFVKKFVEPIYDTLNLTEEDVNAFVQNNLANLVNVAYANLAQIFGNITQSFGGMPFITQPVPVQSAKIVRQM